MSGMLILLSPAKSLDLTSPLPTRKHSDARLLAESQRLIDVLVTKSPDEVGALMSISDDLASLNAQRYRDFELPFTRRNARPALLMFAGDVYQGMDAPHRFDERDYTEANKTIRILSGLYGVLRPLDLIQPYRLEMGTRLATERGACLYDWWGTTITDVLRDDLASSPGAEVVVNLASIEYFTSVLPDRLGARVLSPRFEDEDAQGAWKVMSFSAKRARGEMAAWMVLNRVRRPGALKGFDAAGYHYAKDVSTSDVPVFRRPRGAR